jgi:uncharacterized membrane protein YfcA
MSRIDYSLIVAILITFPLGIYKVFFNEEQQSFPIFGVLLILGCIYLIYEIFNSKQKKD